LEREHFHEAQRVIVERAFLQLRFTFLPINLGDGFSSQLAAVGLKRENILLQPDLGVELRVLLAADISRAAREDQHREDSTKKDHSYAFHKFLG
jgi:hypothetical protein